MLALLCVPTAIIAAIFVFSRGGTRWLVAFATGSMCSLLVVTGVAVAGIAGAGGGNSHATSTARSIFQLVVAAVALVYARRIWAGRSADRPASDQGEKAPSRWMGYLDRLGWVGAFIFGLVWINTVLAIDAGVEIAQAQLSTTVTILAVIGYALAANSGPLSVLVVHWSDPSRAEQRLKAATTWMQTHRRATIAIVLYAVAATFAIKGVAGLA